MQAEFTMIDSHNTAKGRVNLVEIMILHPIYKHLPVLT